MVGDKPGEPPPPPSSSPGPGPGPDESGRERRPDPLVGKMLAERYHLTRKIGEGGMGAVYEARHATLGKTLAVKVLRDKYLDRPSVAQRMLQEARLASAIRNEHIVDITDSGMTDDGRTFVVMELYDGESLAELLRREAPLPEVRAIEIVRQVASALGAAHARDIVHRDVKPENVFLQARGPASGDFVKVLDFGISTTVTEGNDARDREMRLTSTGMVLGTPFYMSPEQARGDDDIDRRIDVYALGVILYECLTAEVPFRGGNYLGIISRVLNDTATPPRALRPELRISEAIERVCLKAMAKRREDRYATMEELIADLDRVLTGEWVEAPLPSAALPRARSDARVWLFAGSAIVMIGGLALLWAGRTGRSTSSQAAIPAAAAAPAPAPGASSVPLPQKVVLHVETDPPGAEVRQGDRVFGLAPRDVILPRATGPVRLSFFLDGYEPGSADVVPSADDTVRVVLTARPRPKAKGKHAGAPVQAASGKKPSEGPADDETLPNPY